MSLHQSYSNNFVIGFGFSRSLPLDQLPTHFDLASHIFHLQSIEPPLSKSEILKSVSQSLMSLWLEAAASPVGTGGIRNKIRKLIERVEVFKKIPSWRRKGSWFPHVLFDITSCTCLRGKDLKRNLKIDTCTCESNLSKPAIKFIQNQRCPRHMRILNGSLIDVGQAKQHSTVDSIMMQVHVNQGEKVDFDEQVIEDNHKNGYVA